MTESRVTEYMVNYIRRNGIPCSELSAQTGIPEEKLEPGYKEPLLAEEFLNLYSFLHLSPEEIANEIKKQKRE